MNIDDGFDLDMNAQDDGVSNLVNWDNPPKLSDLKADFQEAQGSHTVHVSNVETWIQNLNGIQKVTTKKGRSKIVPKLIRKQAEWRYSSLSEPFLSTNDLFNTKPRTFEDKQAAEQNALVLNYQFNNQLNKVKFIGDFVRTCVDEGTVIVKTGWDSESHMEEVEVPIMGEELVVDPETGEQLVQPIEIGSELEEQEIFTKNQPTVEICDYRNLVTDSTCNGNIEKAEFIIHSFETSMSALKKDGRYKNLDRINLDSTSALSSPDYDNDDSSNFTFKDKPRMKFVVNEYNGYWDIHDTGEVVLIIAAWAGDTLIRLVESPMPDGELPFVLVQYLPVRRSNYGQPDGYLLEDNQRVVGAVTRGMIDIMGRSANGQQGIRKDALDVANSMKFERGADFFFNQNVDAKQAFHMNTYPEIPNSAITMLQMQNNEAESLTGVKAFSSGISGQALGTTATGIRSATDATSKRELGILIRLADGIVKIGRKIMSMNSEFLQDEEIFRITNDEFIAIERDNLAGKFDVVLEISTAEADNEKAQELSFMLQTTGDTMDPILKNMILSDIAKLRKMPDLAKRITDFEPEPDPIQQEKALLEIELLKAQISNEIAKGRENTVDIDLKSAKTRTEDAKTRKLHSESDNDDLKFLNDDASVDKQHEIEMEQQRQDGALNMEAAKQMGSNS